MNAATASPSRRANPFLVLGCDQISVYVGEGFPCPRTREPIGIAIQSAYCSHVEDSKTTGFESRGVSARHRGEALFRWFTGRRNGHRWRRRLRRLMGLGPVLFRSRLRPRAESVARPRVLASAGLQGRGRQTGLQFGFTSTVTWASLTTDCIRRLYSSGFRGEPVTITTIAARRSGPTRQTCRSGIRSLDPSSSTCRIDSSVFGSTSPSRRIEDVWHTSA